MVVLSSIRSTINNLWHAHSAYCEVEGVREDANTKIVRGISDVHERHNGIITCHQLQRLDSLVTSNARVVSARENNLSMSEIIVIFCSAASLRYDNVR